ncbi:MAG: hypothetical protein ABSC72_05900 [Methylovirgula sp.]
MFFLIRCVFWLSVVFCTIFSPNNPTAPSPRAENSASQTQALRQEPHSDAVEADTLSRFARAWVSAALEKVWTKATGGACGTAADCAALAGRLEEFAKQHPFAEAKLAAALQMAPVETSARETASAVPADVPLPPARPHHFGRSDRLSQADETSSSGQARGPLASHERAARS